MELTNCKNQQIKLQIIGLSPSFYILLVILLNHLPSMIHYSTNNNPFILNTTHTTFIFIYVMNEDFLMLENKIFQQH